MAQQAVLLGPLAGDLPSECIVKCLTGPAEIFSNFAKGCGYSELTDLFPTRKEDPVLNLLLSIPWIRFEDAEDPPLFVRGLRIPEYDFGLVKIQPSSTALYNVFWIADNRGDEQSLLKTSTYFKTPETFFYGNPFYGEIIAPSVFSMLREKKQIILESSGLLRHPEFSDSNEYFKGIYLSLIDDDLVNLSEVRLIHPGLEVHGVSVSHGRHYRIRGDNVWQIESHPDSCPCNNELLHLHHLWCIRLFEDQLQRGLFSPSGEREFTHLELSLNH